MRLTFPVTVLVSVTDEDEPSEEDGVSTCAVLGRKMLDNPTCLQPGRSSIAATAATVIKRMHLLITKPSSPSINTSTG